MRRRAKSTDRKNRKFLGFSFFGRIETKIRVAPKSLERFRDRVREITARSNGWSMERRIRALVNYVRGWMQYFRLARTPSVYRNLEGWILRRLRLCLWKQWKRPRTRLRKLRALGLPDWVCFASAMSRQGYWRMSGGPMNRAILVHFGTHKALLGQPTSIPKFDEPPDADRHVRWCGRTGMATSPPTRLGFAQPGGCTERSRGHPSCRRMSGKPDTLRITADSEIDRCLIKQHVCDFTERHRSRKR